MLLFQFLGSHLGMGCRSRMNDQRFDIGNISEQAEDFETVDELEGFGLATLHIEGEDGTTAVGEVAFVKLVVRMILEARVVDLCNLRVLGEEFENLTEI